jgi:hypothetical protein
MLNTLKWQAVTLAMIKKQVFYVLRIIATNEYRLVCADNTVIDPEQVELEFVGFPSSNSHELVKCQVLV